MIAVTDWLEIKFYRCNERTIVYSNFLKHEMKFSKVGKKYWIYITVHVLPKWLHKKVYSLINADTSTWILAQYPLPPPLPTPQSTHTLIDLPQPCSLLAIQSARHIIWRTLIKYQNHIPNSHVMNDRIVIKIIKNKNTIKQFGSLLYMSRNDIWRIGCIGALVE